MLLPIVGYGDPMLRKEAQPITPDFPDLKQLIDDMFETMYAADGVGLAAPQIDRSIQLVVIGFRPYDEKTDTYGPEEERHVLINPEILEELGEKKYFNEGCLSIPDIHEDVLRHERIKLHWWDENFVEHNEEIDGMFARVAQHEIDHLHGKVFTDRLSPLRKTMIKRKLSDVASGKVHPKYRMKKRAKIIAIAVLMTMTLMACHRTSKEPTRDELFNTIDSIEAPLMQSARLESIDTAQGNALVALYLQFADAFPTDSMAAPYLHRAAQVAGGMDLIDDMVACYDRVIDNYPDYEKLDECYYEKGIALDNAGRKDEAREAYKAFLEEYPDHFLTEDIRKALSLLDMSDEMLIKFLNEQENKKH